MVPARDAASLILLREAATPGEAWVLMGLRDAGHRFMPNRLVFPGGAVDFGDALAPAASPLSAETQAGLMRGAGAGLARAIALAAARELREETGLSLGEPPALAEMRYLARAITPADQPIRFDARFLVVARDLAQGELAGSGELEGLREYRLDEALALDLAWITAEILRRLRAWLGLAPQARQRLTRFPVCRERVWTLE